jgi:phytoene dehydrogenase-like protein
MRYCDYRTPIRGLHYASSGIHAGGVVCGISGWQAAKAALADRCPRRLAGVRRMPGAA